MQVLKLIHQYNFPFIHKIGEEIGHGGADGEVFSLLDDRNKAIKLSILYEQCDQNLVKHYQAIQKAIEYIIDLQPIAYAHVYEHEFLCNHFRPMPFWKSGKQNFIIHYHIMEKLQKITEDERKVFHSILSHEDRKIKKNFSSNKIKEMLDGLARGLDFDAEKIKLFCDNIRGAPILHLDIHLRNIMKDEAGTFKLIDLDRIELENGNGKE